MSTEPTPPADAVQYPFAQDLDGVWHRRPTGDEWTLDADTQCHTKCGKAIPSVHVSEGYPDEIEADESLCDCCTPDPDRYMMATAAHHRLGDISRDKPDLAVIYGETDTDFIGQWAAGLGFVNVRFPKATTRPLTADERRAITGKSVS